MVEREVCWLAVGMCVVAVCLGGTRFRDLASGGPICTLAAGDGSGTL